MPFQKRGAREKFFGRQSRRAGYVFGVANGGVLRRWARESVGPAVRHDAGRGTEDRSGSGPWGFDSATMEISAPVSALSMV